MIRKDEPMNPSIDRKRSEPAILKSEIRNLPFTLPTPLGGGNVKDPKPVLYGPQGCQGSAMGRAVSRQLSAFSAAAIRGGPDIRNLPFTSPRRGDVKGPTSHITRCLVALLPSLMASLPLWAAAPALAGPPGAVGDLYVSGLSSENVVQFDGVTGAFVCEFVPSGSGGIDEAAGIAFGPNGNLFVCSRQTFNIKEFDGQTGAFIGDFTAPRLSGGGDTHNPQAGWAEHVFDLLFHPDGRLLLAVDITDAVLDYDGNTGEWFSTWAVGGAEPGGLDGPLSLASGANGNVFVTSHTETWTADPNGGFIVTRNDRVIEYHGTTGRLVRVFGADGGLTNPMGMVFRPNGNLLVASSEWFYPPQNPGGGYPIVNEVLEFDGTTGECLGAFVPDGSGLDWPGGMTWGPNGNLFVVSIKTNSVLEFDGQTGAVIGTFATSGLLSNAWGLAFKPPPPDPLPTPTISGLSVAQHDACDPLTGVTVTGVNLDPDETTVMLRDPNEPLGTGGLVRTYVGVVTAHSGDGTWLTVDFDLDGGARMAGGLWDVEVVNPDGQMDALPSAIDIAPCYTAGEENLFVLGYRHRGSRTTHGLFEFDGATGDLISMMIEDKTPDGDDLNSSQGFAFALDGNLLITAGDSGASDYSVLLYDGITGRKLGTFIPAGTGGMLPPRKLTFGPNGNLFVLHQSCPASGVLEFDGLTGAFVWDFVPVGSCGMTCGADMEFGPGGDLYVTHGDTVFVFDGQTGACVGGAPLAVPPPDPLISIWPLEFSPHDANLVLPWWGNSGFGRITVHDPETGNLLATPIPPPAGGIAQANASDFGPNGHLFVSGYSHIFEYDLLAEETLGIFATLTNPSGVGAQNEIIFALRPGDADGDWDVDAADAAAFAACFTGSGVMPDNYNCLTFDFDRDADVDCDDWWAFRTDAWTAAEPAPPFAPCGDPGDPLAGDLDADGDADLDDFILLADCLAGPQIPPPGGCPPEADLDTDGDMDLEDYAAFQIAYTGDGGPTLPGAACCLEDASCIEVTEPLCILFFNGVYQGDGTTCESGCPVGACCLPDGSCADGLTEMACQIAGGVHQGDGSDCSTPCPTGACCSPVDGSCSENHYGRDNPWNCNRKFTGGIYAGLWANLRCIEGESKRGGGDGTAPRLSIKRVETPVSIQAIE